MEVLVFVGFAALIVLAAWWAWRMKKLRREAFGAFAKQYGLQYSPADPFGLLNYAFGLFQKGDGRGVENVLWGAWQGLPAKCFDYWYYTESTDSNGNRSRSYSHFSGVVVDVALGLPPITIERENFFTRLGDHLGLRDIDFESEQFNRAFNVKAQDREFAFKIVDARMMHFLLTTEGFNYEAVGPWLLVYTKRRKPTELVPLLGTAKGFHDQIPRLVWNEYGTAPNNLDNNQDIERSAQ
jgi:hypothetical protein